MIALSIALSRPLPIHRDRRQRPETETERETQTKTETEKETLKAEQRFANLLKTKVFSTMERTALRHTAHRQHQTANGRSFRGCRMGATRPTQGQADQSKSKASQSRTFENNRSLSMRQTVDSPDPALTKSASEARHYMAEAEPAQALALKSTFRPIKKNGDTYGQA